MIVAQLSHLPAAIPLPTHLFPLFPQRFLGKVNAYTPIASAAKREGAFTPFPSQCLRKTLQLKIGVIAVSNTQSRERETRRAHSPVCPNRRSDLDWRLPEPHHMQH